jgi:hypothetical protein
MKGNIALLSSFYYKETLTKAVLEPFDSKSDAPNGYFIFIFSASYLESFLN